MYLYQGKLPLNKNESKYLIELIEEGIKNIGENKIKMIVVDRGFFFYGKLRGDLELIF